LRVDELSASFTNSNSHEKSREILSKDINKSSKKRIILISLVSLILIVAVALTVILTLNKQDDQPPTPPLCPTNPKAPGYHPYIVTGGNTEKMYYKLGIDPSINNSFKFPFGDTQNNYRFKDVYLQG
jgi:hypothetical protein